MACNPELVQYIADQCSGAGEIQTKKMFGEYGIYCDGKIFGLICRNQLFIKITEAGTAMFPDLETAPPYEGAKPHFVFSDIDDRDALGEIYIPAIFLTVFAVLIVNLLPIFALAVFDHQFVF